MSSPIFFLSHLQNSPVSAIALSFTFFSSISQLQTPLNSNPTSQISSQTIPILSILLHQPIVSVESVRFNEKVKQSISMGLFCHFRHSSPFFSSLIVLLLVKGNLNFVFRFVYLSSGSSLVFTILANLVEICGGIGSIWLLCFLSSFCVFQRFPVLHSRSLTSAISQSGREFSPAPAAPNWKPPDSSWKREVLALYKLRPAGPVGSGVGPAVISTAPAAAAATPATAAPERWSATAPVPRRRRP